MRAREFILEGSQSTPKTKGAIHPDHVKTMPSAHRVAGTADRCWDLEKVMRAAGMADGSTPPKIPKHSWAHKNNTAHPYTELEERMLKHAYKAVGVEWDDVLKSERNRSSEPDHVNRSSPVKPFAGYHK
jgi:hypothetical protein